MNNNNQTLFGFPVVVTDAVPVNEIVFGPLPTWQEIALHGSLEAAIEARKYEWAKLKLTEADTE